MAATICVLHLPAEHIVSSSPTSSSRPDLQSLDEMTGGAFTATTAGERAARLRAWLQQDPAVELIQKVHRELSAKDKGAAKLLRGRLDEHKRQRNQEGMAHEWADKAQALLDLPRLNLADALAWQRDAAKAGAPLSREPLLGLKTLLAERVKAIEDLQHRAQVHREAAVLLAQRIEVLSTKSWRDAQTAHEGLAADVTRWLAEADTLPGDAHWASLDLRFAPQLEASRAQLSLVWEAFSAALAQARAAVADPAAVLPQVPVWADELRQARADAAEAAAPAKPKVDPELRAQASAVVRQALAQLEREISQGHGKASAGAANALRQALKEQGRHIDSRLDRQAHAALAAAGELEGWQRWRADQLREELVGKAEALLKRPEGQALGGRKMQESLRELREQWKQTDQGGVPNHALWKRFDEACNQAYKVVEGWLEKIKTEAAEHRARRLELIEELKAWAAARDASENPDWKAVNRDLHQFSERWREAGHLSEKVYAELQPMWKAAMAAAGAPLDAAQKDSLQRRQAMIDEATQLGAAAQLRIDAVKALQQRWQAEAHAVPLDRRQEQKLWDAFRKPIDEAFARKGAAREQAAAAMTAHDRAVLDAAGVLEAASAAGEARAIRAAMAQMEAALAGERAAVPAAEVPASAAPPTEAGAEPVAPAPLPVAPRKPVVAVRGDDRPGMKRSEPAAPSGRARPGERREGPRREEHRPDRPLREAPRLGDAAFRAQRDAMEHAQSALRKLAAQAHGEALIQLLAAWEQRDAARLPALAELGGRVNASLRTLWSQALSAPATADATDALLRIEMAADVPTPAEHIEARRALQLQLLTRRNEAGPAQTWGQDAARVLASTYDAEQARRLQQALKVLLRR
ncbi:MAG: DUF349 domain-containing protein [Curvibacter sp.]